MGLKKMLCLLEVVSLAKQGITMGQRAAGTCFEKKQHFLSQLKYQ